ncbi:MAG: glycosyltransferase family 4 protein [Acetobacteraceae bacterium]|nr:glycosyltransferase family 4 protein [Acetobacteraceae bacterium]
MSAPPAILQVLPRLVAGGVERGTIEIAEAIARAGYASLVASAGGPMAEELPRVGAEHVTLPLDRKSPLALWRNAALLADLARERNVVLIHARSRAPAWSALFAARRARCRFVTTWHGAYSEGLPGKRLYNSVMARGERVIAISGYIADLVRARHGLGEERLRVIPRGADLRRFDPALVPPARAAALRAAWGVPEGAPVLLLPGRLSRWKGQAVLIEAMARVPPPAVAVLAGEGSLRGELEALVAARGLRGRVLLPGHVEDMPGAYAAAELVLHASTEPEAFGRTVVEAGAMARPVIASDLGAPRETVLPGRTGWLVPPGDPAALSGAIGQALAEPPERRAAMGRAARERVLARFTTEAMQRATLAVYAELLGPSPSGMSGG